MISALKPISTDVVISSDHSALQVLFPWQQLWSLARADTNCGLLQRTKQGQSGQKVWWSTHTHTQFTQCSPSAQTVPLSHASQTHWPLNQTTCHIIQSESVVTSWAHYPKTATSIQEFVSRIFWFLTATCVTTTLSWLTVTQFVAQTEDRAASQCLALCLYIHHYSWREWHAGS